LISFTPKGLIWSSFSAQESSCGTCARAFWTGAVGASGKLTRRILDRTGARSPLSLRGREFNMAAEDVYRGELRRAYLEEALDYLVEDCETVMNFGCLPGQFCRTGLPALLGGRDLLDFVRQARGELRQTGEFGGSRLVLTQLLILVMGMHRDNARIRGKKNDASVRN
jgi:hypothetical protein